MVKSGKPMGRDLIVLLFWVIGYVAFCGLNTWIGNGVLEWVRSLR